MGMQNQSQTVKTTITATTKDLSEYDDEVVDTTSSEKPILATGKGQIMKTTKIKVTNIERKEDESAGYEMARFDTETKENCI
jgi:cell division protein FtsL